MRHVVDDNEMEFFEREGRPHPCCVHSTWRPRLNTVTTRRISDQSRTNPETRHTRLPEDAYRYTCTCSTWLQNQRRHTKNSVLDARQFPRVSASRSKSTWKTWTVDATTERASSASPWRRYIPSKRKSPTPPHVKAGITRDWYNPLRSREQLTRPNMFTTYESR